MSAERDKVILIGVSCFLVGFGAGFFTLVGLLNRMDKNEKTTFSFETKREPLAPLNDVPAA